MGDTDYLSLLEGPSSSSYGSGLYDFGYQPSSLPPSGVATTASQVESGGTGVNWSFDTTGVGNLIQDVTKAWITVRDHQAGGNLPTGYARGPDGSIYAVDPAYRNMQQPTVGSTLNHIPVSFLLIGGLIFAALALGDD
jgi:hypothetical protein